MRLLHLAHVTGPLSTRQGRCQPPSVLEAHGVRQGKPVLNRGAGDRERWWPQLPHMDTEPGPCADRATEARAPIEAAVWGVAHRSHRAVRLKMDMGSGRGFGCSGSQPRSSARSQALDPASAHVQHLGPG